MTPDIRANEFRNFALAQTELLTATRARNAIVARLAREELEAIEMHTDWPSLRARCTAVLQATQH